MTGPRDEFGICSDCGGHGTILVVETATHRNTTHLRPYARQRALRRGTVYQSADCPSCDGLDQITDMIEAQRP